MPAERQNVYFIPEDGIIREVIQADICVYLGNDALVKPGIHQGRQGYFFRAYMNLTSEMISDLKEDSRRWASEKTHLEQRYGYGQAPSYLSSNIHDERKQLGPTPVGPPQSKTLDSSRNKTDAPADSYHTGFYAPYTNGHGIPVARGYHDPYDGSVRTGNSIDDPVVGQYLPPALARFYSQPQPQILQNGIGVETQGQARWPQQYASGFRSGYVDPGTTTGPHQHPIINRSYSHPQTHREIDERSVYTASPEFGNKDVQVWSHSKERYIRAEAVLDLGCRGPNGNIISEKFLVRDLQDRYLAFPPGEQPSFTGLGGSGHVKGMVELKFQFLYRRERKKGDVRQAVFYVDEGRYFQSDILLGRDYLKTTGDIKIFYGLREEPKQSADQTLRDLAELQRRQTQGEQLRSQTNNTTQSASNTTQSPTSNTTQSPTNTQQGHAGAFWPWRR